MATIWYGEEQYQHIARYYANEQQFAYWNQADLHVHYQHPDYLGTVRSRTSSQGAVESIFQSLPFGDGYNVIFNGGDTDTTHFAELDHDDDSDTHHAQFRQYHPLGGRWMSPDPYDGSYDFTNPQSLNRYSYVLNNPLGLTDRLGLFRIDCGGPNGCVVVGGSYDPNDCNSSFVSCVSASPDPVPNPICGYCLPSSPTRGPIVPPGGPVTEGSSGSNPAPSNGVPANPCAQAGNAPAPSYYANRGTAARNNPFQSTHDLFQFPRGRSLDAQPYGASPAYGNYVYGVYLRAAGFPLSVALWGANWYAGGGVGDGKAQYSGPMDPNYPNIPPANVANITNGYNTQKNGTVCHVP